MSRTRTLCPRCLESFTPEAPDSSVCPGCREVARRKLGEPVESTSRAEHASPPHTGTSSYLEVEGDSTPRTPERAPSRPGATHSEPRRNHTRREPRFTETVPTHSDRPWWIALPLRARDDCREWCAGRLWWARLPLWIYLGSIFVRHAFGDGTYRSLFDGINLGIHELGHVIFRPLGLTLSILGGSITQLAAPVAAGFVLGRQRDYFGISVCLSWLATNFYSVGVYIADARAQQLQLVAPGMGPTPSGEGSGGIIHDWNFLLGPAGLLRHDQAIAGGFYFLAVVSMVAGLGFGAWILWTMFARRGEGPIVHFDDDNVF